ncbi:SpoIIE family protein phosphatase [Streptomyces pinistramenti]|uniref:SpoIIE family protein phosphatase n=1 Tax=Streptomyces pinistramenti TaxID=2884812 RepID=UPI001D06E507|nr:SpoIIE family protein phosphatase [Streptomyces pinistramenti]MCB5911803.1 SpoIIE family protein phosphatase [Streptomyces pinistramenti]
MAVPRAVPPVPLNGVVVVVIDGRGLVTHWARGAAELLGYAAAEVVGTPARGLLGPRRYPRSDEPYGGAPGGRVLALRHRSGGLVDVWVRLLELGGSSAVLALGVAVDTLSAWSDESALGRTLLAQDVWQMAVHGPDLRIRRSSPAVARAGRLRDDGFDPLVSMSGMDGDRTGADLLRQVMESDEPVVDASGVLRDPQPGKSDLIYSMTAAPVHDLRGRVNGVMTSLVDVTERYRSVRRLDMVYRASRSVSGSLEVERTAQDLVDLLVPSMGDLATVEIAEATLRGGEPPRSVRGVHGDFRRVAVKHAHGPWPAGQIQAGEVLPQVRDQPRFRDLERGQVLVVNDPADYVAFLGDDPEAARMVPDGLFAAIGSALVARGMVLGYVQVYRTQRRLAFDGQDAKLLEEIVTRVALGMDNARRYTREHRMAVMLQNSLLPPLSSTTAAAETAGVYLSAEGEAGVGGDWFDAVPLSSLRTALVVGDVIGHGLGATATMARLRTAVQTLADLDLGPDELLTRLDDLVHRMAEEAEHPDTMGASCLYAVYDPVDRSCRVASAGHPMPAVVHPDGTARFIDIAPGPTLGVGGMPFEVTEVEVPPGSVLALYSNGLIEATRREDGGTYADAEAEVLARLADVAGPGRPLDDIGHDLVEPLRSAPHRPDDITLLLARTRAIPASCAAGWQFPPRPTAVARARELVTEQLVRWGLDDLAFSTELVVSELVTNALRYARGPIGLRLIRDQVLVCEVTDSSNSQPRLRQARDTDEGGRGLFLVAQLTARWGSRYGTSGKTVWTEQLIDPAG